MPDEISKDEVIERLEQAMEYNNENTDFLDFFKQCGITKRQVKNYLKNLCQKADPNLDLFTKVCISGSARDKGSKIKTASSVEPKETNIWAKFRRQKRSIKTRKMFIKPPMPKWMKKFLKSNEIFESLLDCNQRKCLKNPITECSCYNVWAPQDSKQINNYCKNLNQEQAEALKNVAIWSARDQLRLLPQKNRNYTRAMYRIMDRLMNNLSDTLVSLTTKETLESIFQNFTEDLNKLQVNLTTEAEILGHFASFFDNFGHYDLLAELLNEINGFFSLGKSCNFDDIGEPPSKEEYCDIKIGKSIMKNIMPCDIRNEAFDDYDDHDYEKDPCYVPDPVDMSTYDLLETYQMIENYFKFKGQNITGWIGKVGYFSSFKKLPLGGQRYLFIKIVSSIQLTPQRTGT